MVSADDPNHKPELKVGKKLVYMPSAYFGSNLDRYLYSRGYNDVYLYRHFEVDDDFRPFWVVTLTERSIGYSGERIRGVLLVSPETGEIREHTLDDLPEWVDVAVPEALVPQVVNWWGHYVHGWRNYVWGQGKDVMEVTEESVVTGYDAQGKPKTSTSSVTLVWGADNQPYWFSGLTSAAETDAALTGFIYVNSRTGKARLYRLSGYNESAVMAAVNAAVANFRGHHATPPIPYNLFGEMAWVSPVVSADHIFQKVAIVRNADSRVALGATREEALRELKKLLAASGNGDVPQKGPQLTVLTLTLERVGADVQSGNTVYYLYSKEHPRKAFTGSTLVSHCFPWLRPGDRVRVSFVETPESVVPIQHLVIEGLEALPGKGRKP
jgi:hypothetical protein